MSLDEAYHLAHSAECRLRISTDRPDRDLRVVVGHLMHYESLRLRIVEIEHNIGKSPSPRAGERQERDQPDDLQLTRTTSSGDLRRYLPAADRQTAEEDSGNQEDDAIDLDSLEEEDDIDNEFDAGLTLHRFASGRARSPPPLVNDDDDDAEPHSPEEPPPEDVAQALNGPDNDELARSIEKVRNCHCHPHAASPEFEHVWTLPASQQHKPGILRAVAQLAD